MGFQVVTTPNQDELRAFYQLRQTAYWHTHKVEVSPRDAWDDLSQPILVKHQEKVVGGTRVTVSGLGRALPVEAEVPDLHELFTIDSVGGYAEMSRFSVHADYQQGEITGLLFAAAERHCWEQNISQVLFMGTRATTRLHSLALRRLNQQFSHSHTLEVRQPEYLARTCVVGFRGLVTSVCLIRLEFSPLRRGLSA